MSAAPLASVSTRPGRIDAWCCLGVVGTIVQRFGVFVDATDSGDLLVAVGADVVVVTTFPAGFSSFSALLVAGVLFLEVLEICLLVLGSLLLANCGGFR